jgi:hypothetical protein
MPTKDVGRLEHGQVGRQQVASTLEHTRGPSTRRTAVPEPGPRWRARLEPG